MDKMRKDFESYISKFAVEINYRWKDKALNRCKIFKERYAITWVDNMWLGWQASRESLTVELPLATFETPSGDNALREDAVLVALESAGINVVQK